MGDLAKAAPIFCDPPKQPLSSPPHPQPKELRSSYCLHSPERRGSPPVAAACPPPAGHSWCHTSRSDSPGAEDKARVTSLGPPDPQTPPGLLVRSGHLPPLGCAAPSPRTLPVQSCCCPSGLGVEHRKQARVRGCSVRPAWHPPLLVRGTGQNPSYHSRRWQPWRPDSRFGSWPHSAQSLLCPEGQGEAQPWPGLRSYTPHKLIPRPPDPCF